VVHFLNKGGRDGWYLGEDLHGEERGQEWPDGRITGGNASLERDEESERMREEEEGWLPNRYKSHGANEGGALWVLRGATPLQLDRIGRYYPWRPTMHLGRQDEWHLVLWFRYRKHLSSDPFIKIIFHKHENKKLHELLSWHTVSCRPVTMGYLGQPPCLAGPYSGWHDGPMHRPKHDPYPLRVGSQAEVAVRKDRPI
jgi:hypothetical protein